MVGKKKKRGRDVRKSGSVVGIRGTEAGSSEAIEAPLRWKRCGAPRGF